MKKKERNEKWEKLEKEVKRHKRHRMLKKNNNKKPETSRIILMNITNPWKEEKHKKRIIKWQFCFIKK